MHPTVNISTASSGQLHMHARHGIINTTINFDYQYLSQKFIVFSQFLFDDHNLEIRKLGVTKSGHGYLGQFRRLIVEMGNVLGFVQMVCLRCFNY